MTFAEIGKFDLKLEYSAKMWKKSEFFSDLSYTEYTEYSASPIFRHQVFCAILMPPKMQKMETHGFQYVN